MNENRRVSGHNPVGLADSRKVRAFTSSDDARRYLTKNKARSAEQLEDFVRAFAVARWISSDRTTFEEYLSLFTDATELQARFDRFGIDLFMAVPHMSPGRWPETKWVEDLPADLDELSTQVLVGAVSALFARVRKTVARKDKSVALVVARLMARLCGYKRPSALEMAIAQVIYDPTKALPKTDALLDAVKNCEEAWNKIKADDEEECFVAGLVEGVYSARGCRKVKPGEVEAFAKDFDLDSAVLAKAFSQYYEEEIASGRRKAIATLDAKEPREWIVLQDKQVAQSREKRAVAIQRAAARVHSRKRRTSRSLK